MVTVLALAAALLYGSADFLGGMATRHAHVLSVLLVSSTAGMVITVGSALLAGGSPQAAGIAWGACAGAVGGVGFMFCYAGLAAGPMSVVAPLSALVSTVLPVAVALAEGERVGPRVYAGALICVVAIISVSSGGGRPARDAPGAGTSGEPEGRGVAWTQERLRSDERRRRLKSAPEASQRHSQPDPPGGTRASGAG